MPRLRASQLKRGDLVSIRGECREIKDVRDKETSRGMTLVLVFKTGSPVNVQPTDLVETSLYGGRRSR
ncbi:hypothetical protein ABZ752_18480 [Streptomyces roseifaciens]